MRINDTSGHQEVYVTTEQFVTMIFRSSKGELEPMRDGISSGHLAYALCKGIIEDYDITNRSNPIERRSAARIIHEALLTEFSERDEDEWSAAENLLDLYSCRTCVKHIAQVYVKGIMFSHENNVFDVKGNISLSEASGIIIRMLDRTKRIPQTENRVFISKLIQPDEAWEMLQDRRSKLIDVRTEEEYMQGHIDGSICIPLHDISNNPFSVSVRKDSPIILYCQKGYKSSLAAQALINAGYSKIYTIPGIEQYRYNLIK
ncbi:MAG TPA: rhodanese-like domain-containing protein [Mobilitalea sp.]|nr:rhodanese-like domain-containing protein [Mobilitalea sp.]